MASGEDGSRIDRRQLLLVAVAIVALIVAAFLAPQAQPQSEGQSPGMDEPEGPGDGGSGPGSGPGGGNGDGDPIELPIVGDGSGGGSDGGPVYLIDTNESGEGRQIEVGEQSHRADCVLAITPEPRPGDEVTVVLQGQDGPITGATVRFGNRSIGRTDVRGRVSGTVPYRRNLSLSVTFPEGVSCSFDRRVIGEGGGASVGRIASTGGIGSTGGADSTGGIRPLASERPASTAAGVVQETNETTATVPVTGSVEILVGDTPYPGSEIPIRAHIDGVPMRNAVVTVGGERAGRTDETGLFEGVQVPEDGSEAVEVTVARGDFEGSRSITVALLSASVRPAGVLTLPGGRATVVAQRPDSSVEGAVVDVDGARLGTTDEFGRLPVRTPLSLDTTVTVTTERQRATVDMRAVYEATALALLAYALLSAVAAGIAARSYGRRAGLGVLGGATALLGLAVLDAYGGPAAVLLGALVLGLAVFLVTAYRRRGDISSGAESAGGLLGAFGQWLTATALAAARKLEAWIDELGPRLSAVLAELRTRPSSLRDALASLPGKVAGAVRSPLDALQELPARTVGLALFAVVLVVAGGIVGGQLGVVAAVVVLGVVALLVRSPESDADTNQVEDAQRTRSAAQRVPEASSGGDEGPTTLRERWRAFARRVRPRRWRHSTTGDVERAAREQGYPDGPVGTLAAVFRRLEYGDDDVPTEERERAEEAFETLSEHDGSERR